MNSLRTYSAIVPCLFATACVTINVYFPAVAAERAADRIIDDVWGKQPPGAPARDGAPEPTAPAPEGKPTSSLELPDRIVVAALQTLELVIPAAHAQQADLDISSPAIRSITSSMEKRHAQLKPLYDSGAVGVTSSALIEIRDLNAIPLPQRNQARKLVADENNDRNALYREIAVANKHPEWEADIRKVFARRWVDRAAKGWWYQDASGNWKQK